MKILHCCLTGIYTDGFGYQENILSKMHKLQGHDVKIIASTEYYNNNKISQTSPCTYINENKITVQRIAYVKYLPHILSKKLRIYKNLYNAISGFKPNIIFIHGAQFLSIRTIKKYIDNNPNTKVFIDNHADEINSAKNWLSKNILHKIFYNRCFQIIKPYTTKFFGVTPSRVLFLINMYNIPKEKTELLLMGVDDSIVNFDNRLEIRKTIRNKLNIKCNDFVIITGGKIDKRKNLDRVVDSVINTELKLIIFGYIDKKTKLFNKIINSSNIFYVGWLSQKEIYDYIFVADLAVFIGGHSTLWEQVVGCGLPAIFKKENSEHLDIGGNCIFVNETDNIFEIIHRVYTNKSIYNKMKEAASRNNASQFLYSNIAIKAISYKS